MPSLNLGTLYAAIPSKIPGVGFPSDMMSPCREMILYLKPRGSDRSPILINGPNGETPETVSPSAVRAAKACSGPATARPPVTAALRRKNVLRSTCVIHPSLSQRHEDA